MRYRFTNEAVKKWQDKPLHITIAGVVLLIITLVLIAVGYIKAVDRRNNPVNLRDAQLNDKVDSSVYAAYLDIIELPVQFAYVDDDGYYFVWDGGRYSVARMDASEYAQVETAIKEKGKYHLVGYCTNIESDVQVYAINMMNSGLEDSPVNDSNSYQYFGSAYIDVELDKLDLFDLNMEMAVACLTGVFTIIFFWGGLWNMHCVTRYPAKHSIDMERLDREMNSADSVLLNGIGTYLTENYFIYFKEEVFAFRYTDIVWAYMNTDDGTVQSHGITVYLKNGEAWNVSKCRASAERSVVDEIKYALMVIYEKNAKTIWKILYIKM